MNRMRKGGLPDQIAYLKQRPLLQKLALLTADELEQLMLKFIRHKSLRFRSSGWLNDFQPEPAVLEGRAEEYQYSDAHQNTNFFTPFVEKVVVPEGTRLVIFGDIHGDLVFLVQALEQLVEQGILDQHYQLLDDDVYLVFVGDYVNRNNYSVEVMALLFNLYRENIGKAFFVRGNHEYAVSARIVYEIFTKQADGRTYLDNCLLAEFGTKFSLYCFPDFLSWFDYLPMGVYVGKRDETTGTTSYINFCHGGIEPAYNPKALLASEGRYERLRFLDRAAAIGELFAAVDPARLHERFRLMLRRMEEIGLSAYAQTFLPGHTVDLTLPCNPRQVRLGMQWNSFLTESNDEIDIAIAPHHRNLYFGSKLTKAYLRGVSTPQHRVLSMMRGHQHLDEEDKQQELHSPMLTRLQEAKGCLPQWGGMVYTLGDSGFSVGCHSFLVLTMQKAPENWRLLHYSKSIKSSKFTEQERNFLV